MATTCFLVLLAGCCLLAARAHEETYAEVPDSLNLMAMIHNDRVVAMYEKCLMDEGPCTNHGEMLKRHLPDALQTGCVKCTPKQKAFAEEMIKVLMKERKQVWARLCTKYDPSGEYMAKYADKMAAMREGAAS